MIKVPLSNWIFLIVFSNFYFQVCRSIWKVFRLHLATGFLTILDRYFLFGRGKSPKELGIVTERIRKVFDL